MATPSKTVDEILKSYVESKRQRGVFTDAAFDKYAPKPEPQNPVVINQEATLSRPIEPANISDIEKIAKPVLTSWLKGKGGLRRVQKGNLWDTDTTGGVTANEYWKRAKVFDDPTLPTEERLTKMIYGVETSGNPNAWNTTNKFGYMGRAQMGKAFMSDYGIDPTMYMKDPTYQHKVTVNAVKKRIGELKGVYFRTGGKVVSEAKNHHGNSKKEDLLIVNPNNGSIYGAMRYNEIIFSQKDSNKIESLIQKGNTEKLGEFVASARAKHNDFVTSFAGGGKTKRYISLGKNKKGVEEYFDTETSKVVSNEGGELVDTGKTPKITREPTVSGTAKMVLGNQGLLVKIDNGAIYKPGNSNIGPSFTGGYTAQKKSITADSINLPTIKRETPIEQVKQALNPTPSRGSINNSNPVSGGGGEASVGDTSTPKQPYFETNSVKVTQEYLNNFLAYNSAKQRGYSVGQRGDIFDQDGKRVPIDKINSEAKNEQIDVDGKFGPETERAIKVYNTANPNKQIKYRTVDGVGYLESDGYSSEKPDYLQKYYETGKVPRYGIEEINPLTPKGSKDVQEIGIKEASPTIPITKSGDTAAPPRVTPDSVKNLLSSENLQRAGGNIADMANIASAFREANRPLPIYEQTEDWKKYTSMVENKANEGLNSAVQSEFNRNLNANRAVGYGQVVAASGGGGTQGAVLGALGNVNQASANAIGQFAVADQAQRDANLSRFGQTARTNEQVNLSMFSQELQNAQNSRMQAASLIPAIRSQIEGRNDMYNAYGPGSSYQKLIQSQLEKQQAETDMTKRLAENPSLLFGEPSAIGTNDLISMADKSMVEQQKAKYGVKTTSAILK